MEGRDFVMDSSINFRFKNRCDTVKIGGYVDGTWHGALKTTDDNSYQMQLRRELH